MLAFCPLVQNLRYRPVASEGDGGLQFLVDQLTLSQLGEGALYAHHITTCPSVFQIPKKFKETSNLMWFSLIRVYFIFVCLLRLILYNSKPQNQRWDWNQKCFHFILQKSLIKLFTWLPDLTLRFLYIIGCSGPRCGRPAQRFVFRAGQAARAAGRLTGVSASADFCALPRIHEAWKGCEDDFRLCTLLAKNELEAVTVLPTIFFLSRYHDRSEQKPK